MTVRNNHTKNSLTRSTYFFFASNSLFILIALATLHIALTFSNRRSNGLLTYNIEVKSRLAVQDEYKKIGLDRRLVVQLLEQTWLPQGWVYESQTTFREIPRQSKFVNVSPLGFRKNSISESNNLDTYLGAGKSEQQKLVYVFGGSTTFGYGVPDDHTIPAYLSKLHEDVHYVNFGRGNYYSQQENDLLFNLIKKGYPKPVLAIFIDGINERCWGASYEKQLSNFFPRISTTRYQWHIDEIFKPVFYLKSKLSKRFFVNPNQGSIKFLTDICPGSYPENLQDLSSAFSMSMLQRASLCKLMGIDCITFIQPFPGLKNIHKFRTPWMKESAKKLGLLLNGIPSRSESPIIEIHDALMDYRSHAFIDDVHYSPLGNRKIAMRIASELSKIRD